jgi:Tol biopolymer transport system component
VWSSEGHQIAYVSFRNGAAGIYRKPSDGTGGEELVYRHPAGPGIVLTDWSADGKLMSFWSQNSLYSLPLDGSGRASLIYREDANNRGGRFSPDARYLAYNSDRSGHLETYVTPFAATAGSISPGIQVSYAGGVGGVSWRQDQRELYFLSSNGAVMAADITPGPGIKASAPRVLFRLAQPVNGPGQLSGISTRDGQRFVFVENSR